MKQKSWISALLSILLSICAAFLGLFVALEFTFFDSGYLIQCMDKTSYVDGICNVVQSTCQGYVTMTKLNTVALEGYLSPEDIRSEVQRGVAERYRGSNTSFYQAHFDGFADHIRSSLSPEELAAESEDSLARFDLLQTLCENAFQEITRPPFDAALSCVLQYRVYRMWAYLVLLILGISVYLVLRRAVPDLQELWRRLMQALCGGGMALAILGALLHWALPFASWMPEENLSYPLFCAWWSGFAITTALAGLLMLAAGLVWAMWKGTHPAKKAGGADHYDPQPNSDGFAANGRMPTSDAKRTIDLSHALGKGMKPAGRSSAPEDPDNFSGA